MAIEQAFLDLLLGEDQDATVASTRDPLQQQLEHGASSPGRRAV
jgi:hypothetical protein